MYHSQHCMSALWERSLVTRMMTYDQNGLSANCASKVIESHMLTRRPSFSNVQRTWWSPPTKSLKPKRSWSRSQTEKQPSGQASTCSQLSTSRWCRAEWSRWMNIMHLAMEARMTRSSYWGPAESTINVWNYQEPALLFLLFQLFEGCLLMAYLGLRLTSNWSANFLNTMLTLCWWHV